MKITMYDKHKVYVSIERMISKLARQIETHRKTQIITMGNFSIQNLKIEEAEIILGTNMYNMWFHNCIFINCAFGDAKWFNTKFLDCQFINCRFIGSTYPALGMSYEGNNKFINCIMPMYVPEHGGFEAYKLIQEPRDEVIHLNPNQSYIIRLQVPEYSPRVTTWTGISRVGCAIPIEIVDVFGKEYVDTVNELLPDKTQFQWKVGVPVYTFLDSNRDHDIATGIEVYTILNHIKRYLSKETNLLANEEACDFLATIH